MVFGVRPSPAESSEECIRGGPELCDALFPEGAAVPFNHTLHPLGAWAHPDEASIQLAADYYGFAMLSMRSWHTRMLRQGGYRRVGGACKGMQQLHSDPGGWVGAAAGGHRPRRWVHPRHLGVILYSDLLISHMMEAELRLDTHPGLMDARATSDQNLMPSEPLNVGGHATFAMRCYGFDADNPASLNVVEHKLQELESSMPLVPVGRPTGWSFVSHMQHTDEQGVTTDRYKPGWVAEEPGRVLTMQVDTKFPGLALDTLTVRLAYLVSYEHMGKANVTCSGCECEPQTIDAHEGVHVSVQRAVEFAVTQSEACLIRVQTLPETSSAGHKFKVIQLTVRARQFADIRM
ncbi:MAG: hypothetical protein WDW38_004825 [Sanguina aurantia]